MSAWLLCVGHASADERSTPPKQGGEAAQAAGGDSALRGLLRAPHTSVDPAVAQLEALLAELAARPFAQTAGKPGLDRARLELTRLHELIGRRADADAIARRKQLVWAALSLSDRDMARAELAEALHTAILRRERAEAQLKAAQAEREARARSKPAQPPPAERAK